MAREQELIEEARQAERPKFEFTQSNHADVMVDTIVEFLRQSFQNHPNYTYIPRDDTFGPDYEHTNIVIVDRYEQEALFLPVITVSIDSVNTRWLQFSQSPFKTVLKYEVDESGAIKRDSRNKPIPSHYEYVGAYDGSITLQVNANDTLEREELVNLLHVIFAESGRDALYMRGLFVNTVNVGGQSELEYRNDVIFKQAVTLSTYSEWRRVIPIGEKIKSLGFKMNCVNPNSIEESPELTEEDFLPVYDLETTPYVIDDATGDPVLVSFELDAEQSDAPITLVFDDVSNEWRVSDFWQKALEQTMIPWENLEMDVNKEDPANGYLAHAAHAIVQATLARALSSSQGRTLADGTKVLTGGTFVYTDGRVELQSFNKINRLIQSTIVETQNTPNPPVAASAHLGSVDDIVIFRLVKEDGKKNNILLVAKNIELDEDGKLIDGSLYYRILDQLGNYSDELVVSSADTFLDGVSYETMSVVDLFMIMQYADQPFRYSLSNILNQIDKVLEQLGDTSLPIMSRLVKADSLINIKQELINKSEKYLLRYPIGL